MELPVSNAIYAGNTLYIGGVVPTDNTGNILQKGSISGQVQIVMNRLEGLLASCNMTLNNLVFVNVFLSDMNLFHEFNTAYAELMPKPYPARKVLEIKFANGEIMVEFTAIASLHDKTVVV